jgi:apolipoprotein N-acyltransferase
MTTIASLLVLVVGGVLLRFSLDTKVFAILAAVLVMAFAALFWPSIVHSWLLAARLGLAGLVALWLVTWLLHVHRKGYALSFLSGSTGARPVEVVASDTDTADATDQQATSSSLPPVAEETPTPTGTGTVDEDFVISDSSSSPFAPPDEPSADRPPKSSDEQRERGRDDQ